MARRLQSDKILFGTVVALVLFGALMVFSASAVMASEKFGSSNYFLIRQLAWAGAGFVAMVVMMHLDYRRLASPVVVFPAVALQLMLLVVVLFADRSHNTRRWLHLGSASLQPSELSKIVLVVFLAYFLEQRPGGSKRCEAHPASCWSGQPGRVWRWCWRSRTSEPRWPSP